MTFKTWSCVRYKLSKQLSALLLSSNSLSEPTLNALTCLIMLLVSVLPQTHSWCIDMASPENEFSREFKITFLWNFSHNRCNNMGLPSTSSQIKGKTTFIQKYFLTMGTVMIFLVGMIIHMTGWTRTISQLKYLHCLFVKCITKFCLNYSSSENRCCFRSVILINPVYKSSLSRLPC